MRAVLCREFGSVENLELAELPLPAIAPGGVRVAVHAIGVNFADLLVVQGKYQEKPPLPFVPGFEAAGVVVEAADDVRDLRAGDPVVAMMETGAYAEEVVVPADAVVKLPAGMDFAAAAAFPVAYGTAHGALQWRARLAKGEWLLVLGAAGGVGLTAVEIGKVMGARVIACAGGAEKLAVAAAAGAEAGIDYSRENIRERVREITDGHGADVVYDPVGGDAFDAALRAAAWAGRVLVIGFASGRIPQIPANLLLVKNIDAIGFFWGSYRKHRPGLVRSSLAELLAWHTQGRLSPHISHRVPLDRIGEAYRLLRERRSTGKVVITVRP